MNHFPSGLEAQLLGIVVGKERPDLEEKKDSLVRSIADGKKKLVELEDEILRWVHDILFGRLASPAQSLVYLFLTSDSCEVETYHAEMRCMSSSFILFLLLF